MSASDRRGATFEIVVDAASGMDTGDVSVMP